MLQMLSKLLCVCIFLSLCTSELRSEDKIPDEILKKLKEQIKKKGGSVTIELTDGNSGFVGGEETHEGPDPFADSITMRWRVYTNQDVGMAFRFPYYYRILDQYGAKLMRHYGRSGFHPDLEMKTALIADISAAAGGADIQKLAYHLMGDRAVLKGITFKEYDYYSSVSERPHAGSKWAPEDIIAIRGENEKASAMFVVHNGRISGLIADGALAYHSNEEIFNTFEVMNRPKNKRRRQKGPWMTWRQTVGMKKKVFASNGKPMKLSNVGPAPWDQAWELETQHYHLTSHVSPARLFYYGMLCEALWREFYEVYQPDTLIPYKMEIQIYNEFSDFSKAGASVHSPIGFGVGGFFHPTLLCIFAYEKSTEVAPDFTPSKVLAHELSHQFLHVSCNGSSHVPTWINEGLAVYFETFSFQNGKYINKAPRSRLRQLDAVYSRTKSVVWGMGNYLEHYGRIPAMSYGEVYAMTHFWLFGDPKGKARFQKYWKALKAGENGTEAFERIFMEDLIKIYGSRKAALDEWSKRMLVYVHDVLIKLR